MEPTRPRPSAQDLGAEHTIAVTFRRGQPLVWSGESPAGCIERVELAEASRLAWARAGALEWGASFTVAVGQHTGETSLGSVDRLAHFGAAPADGGLALDVGCKLHVRLYVAAEWPAHAPDELVVVLRVRGARVLS